jgi:Arc/MetJ family transcription regulator
MRTNIDLNNELIAEAQKHSKARSKRAPVEEALAAFVAMKEEERRRSTYQERLSGLRPKSKAVRLRSDTRDILRKDRELE